MRFALIGEKLGHSFSAEIHDMLGDYPYELIDLPKERLEDFVLNGDWDGVNVTIPYKKAVLPLCDEVSDAVKAIGSANTLVRKNGKIIGHNTDLYGFCQMAERQSISFTGQKVLILGSGGTSLTAQEAARRQGAREIIVVSRTGPVNYGTLSDHQDAEIIVNTTPVGMYPNVDGQPINLSKFPACRGVLDVIYNPLRTRLILQAKKAGVPCGGGLYMLVAQAKAASELFTEQAISYDRIDQIYSALIRQRSNIVLVGMPGCGKTSIGKKLADEMGRPYMDLDWEIERLVDKNPAEIIRNEGEEVFREIESRMLHGIAGHTGIVISTGGGTVTREENNASLKQNGVIFFLERNINDLSIQGRPLSEGTGTLQRLYKTRLPMYVRFADHTVNNDGTPEQLVKRILEAFDETVCD